MARLWAEQGEQVTVIAGTIDYNSGQSPERYRGHWVSKENDGNVLVYRCHVPATYAKSYMGRMWAFLGFTLSASSAAVIADRADVVIASSPPLVAAIPGWIAARLSMRRIPWVFEVRDLWPESAVTTGVLSAKSVLTKMLYGLEKWACWSATKINVLTPAFLEDIVRRNLAPGSKITFVPNGADVQQFSPGPRDNDVRRQFAWGNRYVVMYSGAHGRANALHQLLDAAQHLSNRPDILIALVGDGPERSALEADARRRKLDNVAFCGPQPKARMPEFINASDIGAAVLQNNPTFRTVYPNKVFDYMSCERPIVLAIDGVARKLVCEDAQAGVFAQPENGQAIAGAIRGLADNAIARTEMGRSGRKWVLANATRDALAESYLNILKQLMTRRSGISSV